MRIFNNTIKFSVIIIIKILACDIFLLVIALSSAYAKWENIEDAPVKNSYTEEININSDGTYESIEEVSRTILTEIGRSNLANMVLYYNGDSEKIEILDAKTIYEGKEYKLDKNLIEDKPLASSYNGFDQYKQIFLVFPRTEIGATLYLKYKFIQKKPILENFFANTFYFGNKELVVNSLVKINSKIPLHILINDPEKSLKIAKRQANGIYGLDIVLTKPIYKNIRNELEPIIIDEKHLTWISVSSLSKWEDFAIKYGELFTKIFTQKLPSSFEQILRAAKQTKNEIEQINIVTSLLNDKIRYMGDWRSINGRFVPHDLYKISKNQLGDCKDFSAVTAAILTKLGYKTQFAVVMRGVDKLSKNTLPGFEFNHAIVKVTGKNGVIYWVDPTNFESMADGIFPDISNKMVLILDPKHPSYERIPKIDPARAQFIIKRQLEVMRDNEIIEKGYVFIKNESALGLIGGALKVSDEAIKNTLFTFLADGVTLDDKSKISMELPKLNSRIVKDISISYSFKRENDILKTNLNPALKLTCIDTLSRIYNISQDCNAKIFLSNNPFTFKRQTIIKNINARNVESLNKEMKTPWLYIKRECRVNQNHDLQIDEDLVLYKNLISSEDFKKTEFINFKKWLKDNFKDVILLFEPKK